MTYRDDVDSILEYYETRTEQFAALQNAIYFFEKKDDVKMWHQLFQYAQHKDESKELFGYFNYDVLCTLSSLDVQFIIGIPKDE